jgi:hypothetical protein
LSVIGALGGAFYLAPAQTSADSAARQIVAERSPSRMLLAATSTSYDDLAILIGFVLTALGTPV